MRVCWLFVLLSAGIGAAFAGVGDWKSYTAKRNVRDIASVGTSLWAATSGGVFAYTPLDGTFREFTTSEGLRTIDVTAITGDASGNLWIGASSGIIHRYSPATGAWQYINDIAMLNNPQKRINKLLTSGDTLFILSDVGVSVYSISRGGFGDTYQRFGLPPSQLAGSVVDIRSDSLYLWIATRSGVARTFRTNPNPSEPSSWQVFTQAQGFSTAAVTGLVLADRMFAATGSGLMVYNDTTWQVVQGTAGLTLAGVSVVKSDPHAIYFVTSTSLWRFNTADTAATLPFLLFSDPSSRFSAVDSFGNIGTGSNGILVRRDTMWRPAIPPGPPSNRFVGIAVDGKSVVWSGTGKENGDGFMSFDGASWRSYNVQTDPSLGSNEYYKVSVGAGNAKWISSWGSGVALVNDDGGVQRVYNTSNGIPPSIDPSFVVVGGVATDQYGTVWITNRTGRGDTSMVKIQQNGSLSYVIGCGFGCRTRSPENIFADVTIDQYGTKWFANYSRFEPLSPFAFYYYNESYTLPGTSAGWGKLTSDDGLTSNKVYSVAVDRDGALWVGSDQGISIIFDPSSPRGHIAPYHPLRDQIIQGIVVDPLNNKWVGTKQGVFILSNDGTTILDRYTFENTGGKLLDNDVASLAIDPRTGVVYFGTERGLSSITTAAVSPTRTFSDLNLSPNPFLLPSSAPLLIDGLVQGSSVKILAIDGTLVRELRTPGGRVGFWDGRDANGDLVATGIYIVVAYSEDGSKVSKTKVAVVRR